MLIWLISPAATMAMWAISLRRTPLAFVWFVMAAICAALVGIAGFAIAHDPHSHVTLAGLAGIEIACCAPAALAVLFTEICANDEVFCRDGQIRRWRDDHPEGPRWSLHMPKQDKWEVQYAHERSGDQVRVVVSRGEKTREVGRADPVEQTDEFMDLKVKAEDVASQLNGLKIE